MIIVMYISVDIYSYIYTRIYILFCFGFPFVFNNLLRFTSCIFHTYIAFRIKQRHTNVPVERTRRIRNGRKKQKENNGPE